MKKSKILLPIMLIVSLAIVISSVVVSLTAGINLGIDFVGGKQIEIQVPDGQNTESYAASVADVLDDYGLSIDSSYDEDKFTSSYFVVKINTQDLSAEKASNIRSDIAEKLSLPLENVSEVLSISGSVTQKTVLTVGFSILGILVAIFAICWLRYGVMEALAILFGSLHVMIISFAIILLTRVPLTVASCVSIFASSVAFAGLFALILEKARETLRAKTNNQTPREVYADAFNGSLVMIVIVLAAMLLFGIATLFVSANIIKLFAVSVALSALVAFYSLFVSTTLCGYLAQAKVARDKHKLSKNN
ncbi:MAG: hypothetical protein IJW24_04770 [Clostridia bacterium]|nr:hypothetical protein [Clostridia bacterium]